MKKVALITGISGQDGIYLSRFLLKNNYEVHGIVREKNKFDKYRLKMFSSKELDSIHFHKADLVDYESLERVLKEIKPTEIYNLGAQTSPELCETSPDYTFDVNALGVGRLCKIIYTNKLNSRLFQAGSILQLCSNNSKKIKPVGVYKLSKDRAYDYIKYYRKKYGIFAVNGFLSNHESPFRSDYSLSKKIVKGIIKALLYGSCIKLYNLDYKREWGHAEDYTRLIWLALNDQKPRDVIISTDKTYSIREFCELVCDSLDIAIIWREKGKETVGMDSKNKKILVIGSKENPFAHEGEMIVKNNLPKLPMSKSSRDIKCLVREMVLYELELLSDGSNLALKESHPFFIREN